MLEQVDTTTTIFGLIFFFVIFLGVLVYAFNPKKKAEMKKNAEIPLK